MQEKQTFKRLQHTLMLAFLVLSITPLTALAIFFLQSHSNDLAQQSTAHLASLRDTKQDQLTSYFGRLHSEVKSFARSELANASGGRFYGLVAAFHQLGENTDKAREAAKQRYIPGSGDKLRPGAMTATSSFVGSERYRLLHKRYHWAYEEHLKRSDFADILLVDVNGNVVYSVQKNNDFGVDLKSPEWKDTQLGKTFAKIRAMVSNHLDNDENIPVVFTDFSPEDGKLVAWFAAPISQQGYLHSFVIFKLDNQPLTRMLTESDSKNSQVSTLVVGADHLPRIGQTNLTTRLDSTAINRALDGQSDVGSFTNFSGTAVLGAFAPVSPTQEVRWAMIVELPEKVAFARIYQLEKIFLVVMLTAIVLVTLASHWLSNSITAPLLRLTWAAERVSAGDLEQQIQGMERKDEIGRLAVSFARMQRSVRDKLALIREQNKELENSLALIQQKNQELELADKLKDDFLATTSHELRTPLHGMIGIAESLIAGANGPVPQTQQHQLQMLVNSGQRLSNLVDDLLDYHKMRYGDLEIEPQAVDASAAVRLVLELSTHLLGNKPVRIINQMPVDLPLVKADEQRLEQILYNLIGNAIKYTDEGKIIISATVLEQQIRIQVVDTGQGIPAEQLEHIFEPLIQLHSNGGYRPGAGLGLSISRQLIDIMGGQLYVSSQPMIGTTFSFTLPFAGEAEIARSNLMRAQNHFSVPVPENLVEEDLSLPENTEGPLILAVDDEPVNLQIIRNFLRLAGYRVLTAETGKEALTLAEQEKPELVLLDVMMPELSGYEVCRRLREQYTRFELPVIMLSALGQVQDRVKGFEAGANDYIIKPFNKDELAARIGAYLDASKAEKEREENRRLVKEIHHREQVEAGLLETQNRLLGLLETASEAILCVQENGRIQYANDACGRLLRVSPESLERHAIDDFLMTPIGTQTDERQHYTAQLKFNVDNRLETVETDVIHLPEESGLRLMLVLNTGTKATSQRVQLLENAVEALSEFVSQGDRDKLQQLRELGGEFTRLADRIDSGASDKTDLLRETLVRVMTTSLNYWSECSGKSKFELAEESGLWRVYLDRSTLQTRTLDKYLHVETVPKAPRWRTVLNTIDFVLERCEKDDIHRREIITLREKLQRLIAQ